LGYAAIQTGDEQFLFAQGGKELLERRRQLHAAFLIEPGGVHPARRLDHLQLLAPISHFLATLRPEFDHKQ
jgi:hypothetical protein